VATTTTTLQSIEQSHTLTDYTEAKQTPPPSPPRADTRQHHFDDSSNFQDTEYATTSQYLPDSLELDDIQQRAQDQDELTQNDVENDYRQRQEFAGNDHANDGRLVFNAQLKKAESQFLTGTGGSASYRRSSSAGGKAYLPGKSETGDEENNFIHKMFVFKKSLNTEKLALKRQIMKSLNREDLDLEDLSSLSEISELTGSDSLADTIDPDKVRFDRPFSIGVHLDSKANPLEVGNHVIDRVEAGSASEKAGMRVNSKLVRINEVGCEDKTHEFVMFYLNYVLRKADIETVELVVKEPFYLLSASNISRKPHRAPSFSRVQTLHENFTAEENRFLKAIVRGILHSSDKRHYVSTSLQNFGGKSSEAFFLNSYGDNAVGGSGIARPRSHSIDSKYELIINRDPEEVKSVVSASSSSKIQSGRRVEEGVNVNLKRIVVEASDFGVGKLMDEKPFSREVVYEEERGVVRPPSYGFVYDHDEESISRAVSREDRPSSRRVVYESDESPSSNATVYDYDYERSVGREVDRPSSRDVIYEERRASVL